MKRIDIAREVVAGYWGSGAKRVAALKKAGYDPDVVQGDVNTILCCRENIINNIKAQARSIAANNNWWYIYWTEKYGRECAICHPHGGENHGWQCIGAGIAAWHHGGLPIYCNCGVIDNGTGERIYSAKTDADALKIAQKAMGIKDIKVIRNNGKAIPKSQTQPGDIGLLINSDGSFQHLFVVMSQSTLFDSTSGGSKADNIRADRSFSKHYTDKMKVLIRYTGKGLCSPPKRTVDQLAHEVIEGFWGSNTSRVTALKEAGHDYDAVQKRVNEILNPPKPTPPKPEPTPGKKYTGKLPTTKLVKSNAEVIADTIKWCKWIVSDNRFHYGYGEHAHHNGCYFCGTQRMKKGHGIVDPEFTYCCNPFIGAAWAHGGCIPTALRKCQNYSSWDFNKGTGYDASSLFDKLGHPAKSKLKAGDVLCTGGHVALYIGDGKLAEASGGDDNKRNSSNWNNSIRIATLTDGRYRGFERVYRYNSSVNTTMIIRHGEISERVRHMQEFINWYYDGAFFKECGGADGYYGDNTLKWVKKFQAEKFGKKEADGLVGNKTIGEMAKYAA
jgi:hypothetical protein